MFGCLVSFYINVKPCKYLSDIKVYHIFARLQGVEKIFFIFSSKETFPHIA